MGLFDKFRDGFDEGHLKNRVTPQRRRPEETQNPAEEVEKLDLGAVEKYMIASNSPELPALRQAIEGKDFNKIGEIMARNYRIMIKGS